MLVLAHEALVCAIGSAMLQVWRAGQVLLSLSNSTQSAADVSEEGNVVFIYNMPLLKF